MIVEGIDISSLICASGRMTLALEDSSDSVGEKEYLLKAGAIQHFEFCFELAWKTLKRILANRGKNVNSPKVTFREAAVEGLIDDPLVWFNFLEKRNLTSHTYDQCVVEEIYQILPSFEHELNNLLETIKKL